MEYLSVTCLGKFLVNEFAMISNIIHKTFLVASEKKLIKNYWKLCYFHEKYWRK